MSSPIITSPQNQRVKDTIKLRDRRQRKRQGRIAIDGAREVLRAIEGGVRIVEAFVCPSLCASDDGRKAMDRLTGSDAVILEVTPGVFEKLAFGNRQEGVLAVAETPRRLLEELTVAPDSLIAVVSGLEKPGNVGAVLRSADAAGVAAVIVADPATDLFNPNCVRASLGTVFTLSVCETTSDAALAWLRARGAKLFAAQPGAARLYTDVDYRGDVALVLGSEAAGLDPAWQVAELTPIRLPMHGRADSLNVSATAAVLFYEALRQREMREQ
jgi:TrmH family RNA methyltransferase